MKEVLSSYETLTLTRATWHSIPEDTIVRCVSYFYVPNLTCILVTRHKYTFTFTSSPSSLLSSIKASVFLIIISMLYPSRLISSAWARSWWVSNLLSLHLSLFKIFSSAHCSLTPSVYVPPSMLETKFYTHIEPQATL
jgi:hypothetical protein